MKQEGEIYWEWKGEGYWAYNIFNFDKELLCVIGWSHDKKNWILMDFEEEVEIDYYQLLDIIKLFKKAKKRK